MIGRISGILLEKNPPEVLVDAQGIGYEIGVPMSTFYNLPKIGEKVVLLTVLIVREDAQLLYGFGTEAERVSFKQLIKVSGVGPKVALAVLSGLSANDLAHAVQMQETGRLTKIPGIGKKTADRLLLELKDRLKVDINTVGNAVNRTSPSTNSDVMHALMSLGYNEKEALFAIKNLPTDIGVSEGIRQSLKQLSKP
jgi:holliday junction DNA helicase RuvA